MIEFVSETDKQKTMDDFEQYYVRNIAPLVDKSAYIKSKQHVRFWTMLWSVIFLNSANVLIVLYRHLMFQHRLSYEQLVLAVLLSICLIYYPIYKYKHFEKPNIFAQFLKYYNFGEFSEKELMKAEKLPIIPPHDVYEISRNVKGIYRNIKIEMWDIKYAKNFTVKSLRLQRTVGKGTRITIQLPKSLPVALLLFDKSGFYRKKKFDGYTNIKFGNIPSSNYFICFGDNENAVDKFIRALLFESLMDLKENSNADKIYFMAQGNTVEIFLEGSSTYVDIYSFWGKNIDKDKFCALRSEFEHLFSLVETISTLQEMAE